MYCRLLLRSGRLLSVVYCIIIPNLVIDGLFEGLAFLKAIEVDCTVNVALPCVEAIRL